MQTKDAILATYGMAEMVMDRYLDGLSDADLLVRPVEGQNHIAWQLGHLLVSERGMLDGVKPGSSPPLPAGFEEAHGRDDTATGSDDSGRFLTKEKYLALIKAQREATKAVIQGISEAELDAPSPEKLRQMTPNAGGVLNLLGNHIMMHVGQFVSVRRKLKKPVAI